MPVLKDKDREALGKLFADLPHPVKLVVFTQERECEFCAVTREMVTELAALSPRIALEVKDLVADEADARRYGIDKLPAIVVEGERDHGIRFFGVPAGYEFMSLVEAIRDVGRREHGLPAAVVAELAKIDRPVHLQVMVSPTCPYCPRAVRSAHRFAMASAHIRGDMVEVTEFPHLAVRYQVQGVPDTVINETGRAVGALPELELARKVLEALSH